MKKVHYRIAASQDLEQILEFIARDKPEAALAQNGSVSETCERKVTSRNAISAAYDEQRSLVANTTKARHPERHSGQRPRAVGGAQQERIERPLRDLIHRSVKSSTGTAVSGCK